MYVCVHVCVGVCACVCVCMGLFFSTLSHFRVWI